MKVSESFLITEAPEKLWEFFEQVDEVARCVPGVESVEQVDADNSKVRMTQAVGPMTATFDLKMRITRREPQALMEFTAIGRAVRGAAGNVRSTNVVRLAPEGDGTRVALEADVAMGGMLGTVGQKVIAKQAGKMTKDFAESLERRLTGGAEPAPEPEPAPPTAAPAEPAVAAPAGAAPELAAPRALPRTQIAAGVGALLLVLFALLVRSRRTR
jgi:carbon monoxide dehydrogenase subunit G